MITTSKQATKDAIRDGIRVEGHSDLLSPKTIMVVDEVPILGTYKTDYVTAQKLAEEELLG